MIDDKKIEEAFKEYNEKVEKELSKRLTRNPTSAERYADTTSRQCAFIAGAKWMQEELLKDLWHPNTEKPKAGKKILAYTIDGYETITYIGEGEIDSGTNWMDIISDMAIASWCYPEDLLPKKGGENERT